MYFTDSPPSSDTLYSHHVLGNWNLRKAGTGTETEKIVIKANDRSRGHYKPDWLASSYIAECACSWNLAEHSCASLSVIVRGIYKVKKKTTTC